MHSIAGQKTGCAHRLGAADPQGKLHQRVLRKGLLLCVSKCSRSACCGHTGLIQVQQCEGAYLFQVGLGEASSAKLRGSAK